MHYGRILAVVGVIVSAVGFMWKKASSAGEEYLPVLNQANSDFPASLDQTTWSALYEDTAWAAIVFAVALLAALIIAFMPPIKEALSRMYGMTATVIGVLMLAVGVVALMSANDTAADLEAGFVAVAQGGLIPEAFTVPVGMGWYLLILGGALVAIGGVVSLMARPADAMEANSMGTA